METIASSTKDTAILRVKRKREDDPVDVFLFQVNNVHNSKKRGLLSPKAEQGHGVFRRKETIDKVSSIAFPKDNKLIEAEWDANSHKMKLKRKYEGEEEESSKQRIRLHDDKTQEMEKFTDLLSEYLKINAVDLAHNDDAKENKTSDYVYDIYYQENMPEGLVIEKKKPTEKASKNLPPVVKRATGRTSTNINHSPVPLSQGRYAMGHETSAPGFEHLDDADEHELDRDWAKEASFYPVHLRTIVDENGRASMVAIPIGTQALDDDDLLHDELEPTLDLEEDEDSNEEDFYRNDYPDRDEWDASSEEDSDF